MATEPLTPFTTRLNQVTAALSMTGVTPAAAPDMIAADEKITSLVASFDERTAARAVEDYAESGKRWAKKPTKAGLDKLIDELNAHPGNAATRYSIRDENANLGAGQWITHDASTPYDRRLVAMRNGIINELIASHDTAEFSTAKLVASCKKDVTAWFERRTQEFTEAWNDLDEAGRQVVITHGGGDPAASLLETLDVAHTPEATISAYRRFARVLTATVEAGQEPYARLARAMAFGDVAESTADSDKDMFEVISQATSVRGAGIAVWAGPRGCALFALGGNNVTAVTGPSCEFAPLPDPLGADRDELDRRLEAMKAATAWLDYRRRTVGDPYRGKGWYEDYERFGLDTPEASLEALAFWRPGVFDAE